MVEAQELLKRAEGVIQRFGSIYISPDFKSRNVPGVWGSRTPPLPFNEPYKKLAGLLFIAQQYPSLATVAICESVEGEMSVLHNFDPSRPFSAVLNEHLHLIGDQVTQDPILAEEVLNYLERTYQTLKV